MTAEVWRRALMAAEGEFVCYYYVLVVVVFKYVNKYFWIEFMAT